MTLRELLRRLSGRRWSSKVYATTPHGTYKFEITEVSGELGGETMLHLKEVLPERITDRDGDTWVRAEGDRYKLMDEDGTLEAGPGNSLRYIRQHYGVVTQ